MKIRLPHNRNTGERSCSKLLFTGLCILPLWICSAAFGGSMTEEEWQAKKTKFDLADREKSLLKDDDELSYIINDTEIQIKTLANTLKVTLSERDRVRHELIIVRIKLLH